MFFRRALFLFSLAAPLSARAQMLDELLPSAIPGYAQEISWLAARRAAAPGATGWGLAGLNLNPSLATRTGYDSAPNGSASSSVLGLIPSLLVADPVAGFGAYAEVEATAYPQNSAQNVTGAALAAGERAQLPGEMLTLSAAFLKSAESGFALSSFTITRPIAFTLKDIRARDDIAAGCLTVSPRLSASVYNFPGMASQNWRDLRTSLRLHYDDGAPLSYVTELRAGFDSGAETSQSANDYAVLAGLQEKADGLWTVSALAGDAWRVLRVGQGLAAPVMEARLDWSPDQLDELHLNLAREIDDPGRLSATPYTLTEAKFSFTRTGLRDLTAIATVDISNAAYIHAPLRETLFTGSAGLKWHMSPALAVEGRYVFNDRQSGQLGAANEHVLTLGVSWAP
ncbi:MAG: outer membrane beta-barrel protein [Rhodospirillales bacterium]|nr:outer membrane beta-barrel protein [Rhodospirillales bacterium]MDE2319762.1 outer membrane beta-barrel protein [Rhodospirillales bacterium]